MSAGLASWSGGESEERKLIVRGQANLLDDLHALEDLERVRLLFDDLEEKRARRRPARPRRACRRHAHLHRLGEQAVLALRLLHHRVALSRRAGAHRRRARRDRPDAAELRAHHPDGRLHRQGGQQGAGRMKPASQQGRSRRLDFCALKP